MAATYSAAYKLATATLAGISGSFCFIRIGHRFLAEWLPVPVMLGISICFFLSALGYGIFWAFFKKEDVSHSFATTTFLHRLIRYAIVIDLIMIGMQGFFQFLFFVNMGVLDLPFSAFSGEQLTWAYFGHYSRGFVYFISSIQILGSLLLLFRRTTLTGVFILVPVMFAIVSLNYFFDMERAESIHALEILIALLYILSSEGKRLMQFLFPSIPVDHALSYKTVALKNVLRISAVLIPAGLLYHYGSPDLNPWLTGKYRVSSAVFSRHMANARTPTDSLLTKVYLDLGNDCVFEFNNQDRRWYGTYHLSEGNKKITITWRYPSYIQDTLTGNLNQNRAGAININGKMGKDSILLSLVRQTQQP